VVAYPDQPFDAAHWRNRAEEARAVAEMMVGHAGREEMLKLALAYERMAERSETFAQNEAIIKERKSA